MTNAKIMTISKREKIIIKDNHIASLSNVTHLLMISMRMRKWQTTKARYLDMLSI
jgi:hypothetical protein